MGSNPLDILASDIPGVKQIEDALSLLDGLMQDVKKFAQELAKHDWLAAVQALAAHAPKVPHHLETLLRQDWREFSKEWGGTLFSSFVEFGLGIKHEEMNAEAKSAVGTIDTMIAFATLMPIAFTGFEAVLKGLFGQRATESIARVIGELPQEMGLSWAMGMLMDRVFEAALGNQLEEAILHQKRPIYPDYRFLRLMLKQHTITAHDFEDRLAHLGFPDEWVKKMSNLVDVPLPVGDIQQAFLWNLITAKDVNKKLNELGFNDADAELLKQIYIDHIETQAGTAYRAAARELFRNQLINEEQYREVLVKTSTAPRTIADDIAAVVLEQQHGRIAASVTGLKAEVQRGNTTVGAAKDILAQLGYSERAASELTNAWLYGPIPHPMSASKVLSYWASGVITNRGDAYNRLIQTHLRPQDANFLLDHPTAAGARVHRLTPGLITQAYLDGVIEQKGLESALTAAGLTGDVLSYQKGVAEYRKAHRKQPPDHGLPLSVGQVLDAFEYSIWDQTTAQTYLEHMGYTSDDALLLLEIKNKGPIKQGRGGTGGTALTIEQAYAFLESIGYTVKPPPDPMIVEAENVLSAAGYSWIAPINPTGLGYPTGGPNIPGGPPASLLPPPTPSQPPGTPP